MKLIRKWLVKLFGLKAYLQLVSRLYLTFMSWGWFKSKYTELHFISKIIQKGDTVVDIGANLSYYSFFMSKNIGQEGQLLAVEPIPLFVEVWKKNMSRSPYKNYSIENCALGNEAKEHVKMYIPMVNGVVRHGLTKIGELSENQYEFMEFEVPMWVGDDLLAKHSFNQINYIKCDVEGYERYVMPSLKSHLTQFKPVIQIELNGKENRQEVAKFLSALEYRIFILKTDVLQAIDLKNIHQVNQDFYFIHPDKIQTYSHLIRS